MSKDNVAIAIAATTTVAIGDKDIDFNVGVDEFNQYLNEQMPNDKVNPAFNFLMRTVTDDHKEDLKRLVMKDGKVNGMAALQIAGVLAEQFSGGLNISLKKPKG